MKKERENIKSYQQQDVNHGNKNFGIKKSSGSKQASQKIITHDCIWKGSDLFPFFLYLLNSPFKSSISLNWEKKNNLKSEEYDKPIARA